MSGDLMLSDADLAQLRQDVQETMPETVAIQRFTIAINEYGDAVETWATASTVKGRLDPLSNRGQPALTADREALRVERQLTVPWDADLRPGDRVAINGRVYEVKLLDDDHSFRAVRRAQITAVL